MKTHLKQLFIICSFITCLLLLNGCDIKKEQHKSENSLKIVSLLPSVTQIILQLGYEDSLVGITFSDKFNQNIDKNITNVGDFYSLSKETVLSLDPTTILAPTNYFTETLNYFKKLNIEIIYFKTPTTLNGVVNQIIETGKIFGDEENSRRLAQQFIEQIYLFNNLSNTSPQALLVVGYGEGGDYTAPDNTYLNEMLEIAGFNNAAKSLSQWRITKENLLALDPDIIIVLDNNGDYTNIFSTAPYKGMRAVHAKNVYPINANDIGQPSINLIKAQKALYDIHLKYDKKLKKLNYDE